MWHEIYKTKIWSEDGYLCITGVDALGGEFKASFEIKDALEIVSALVECGNFDGVAA